MSQKQAEKIPVLVVDDEPENLKALERTLRGNFVVELTADPLEALRLVATKEFAVVVSDQRMPSLKGTELLARIAEKSPRTTRVILTAYTEAPEILEAINRAEIYRYVTKPWNNEELVGTVLQAAERYRLIKQNDELLGQLRDRNAELEELNLTLERRVSARTEELEALTRRLAELAMTDSLTKLPNRRAVQDSLLAELDRAKRYDRPLTVAIADIDYFKALNDAEGHLVGDEALRRIAQTLATCLRRSDGIGRFGGEEFLVLMPETTRLHAKEIGERLRKAVEQLELPVASGVTKRTVSIGIATFPEDGRTSEELLNAADRRLYDAKKQGRNKVVSK